MPYLGAGGRWLCRIRAGAVALLAAGALVFGGVAFFDLAFYSGYTLPGPSMEPAIKAGTHLWTRPVNSGEVRDGDIVLLRPPASAGISQAISRVIAVEGQTVSARAGHLFVDGHASGLAPLLPAAKSITIPRNTVYVLGDNRLNSDGSNQYGPVPISSVTQRVVQTGTPTSSTLLLRGGGGVLVALLSALVGWRILRRRDRRPSDPVDPGPRPLWAS